MQVNRVLVTLGLAAAAMIASPLAANAQTAPNYNYVGIGGSDDGFMVNGKVTLSDHLSVRPAVSTDFDFDDNDDANYVLPVTYDFNALGADTNLYPYLGAGIRGNIGDNSETDFAVVGGVDYRINERFLVNAGVNWAPFQDNGDDVGVTAGIGYSF
jgi:opacity protein-like surface antigen